MDSEFALHEFNSPHDVTDADPGDFSDGFPHYLWAWVDESAGHIHLGPSRRSWVWRRTRRPVLLRYTSRII